MFNYLIVILHISSKLNHFNDRYIHTYLYLVVIMLLENKEYKRLTKFFLVLGKSSEIAKEYIDHSLEKLYILRSFQKKKQPYRNMIT